jgi:putative transcription factor
LWLLIGSCNATAATPPKKPTHDARVLTPPPPSPTHTKTSVAAGTNAKGAAQGKSAAKLENETEDFHHEKVSSDLKKQIIAARTAKKLTQAQLAQQINEKPQLVQEYESGKAIPNPQVLSKMSRVLGVMLKRGK